MGMTMLQFVRVSILSALFITGFSRPSVLAMQCASDTGNSVSEWDGRGCTAAVAKMILNVWCYGGQLSSDPATKEIAERDGLPSNHQLKNFIDERREVSPDLPDLDLVTLQLILEWKARRAASFTCSTTGCNSRM